MANVYTPAAPTPSGNDPLSRMSRFLGGILGGSPTEQVQQMAQPMGMPAVTLPRFAYDLVEIIDPDLAKGFGALGRYVLPRGNIEKHSAEIAAKSGVEELTRGKRKAMILLDPSAKSDTRAHELMHYWIDQNVPFLSRAYAASRPPADMTLRALAHEHTAALAGVDDAVSRGDIDRAVRHFSHAVAHYTRAYAGDLPRMYPQETEEVRNMLRSAGVSNVRMSSIIHSLAETHAENMARDPIGTTRHVIRMTSVPSKAKDVILNELPLLNRASGWWNNILQSANISREQLATYMKSLLWR